MKVVFRKLEGDIIALFPNDIFDSKGNITSYMHIGQHGGASPELINKLPKAMPSEYKELAKELKAIGYKI